jgi:hypothetical protein
MQANMAMFYRLAPLEVKQEIDFVIATTAKFSKERTEGISTIFIREAKKHGGNRAAKQMRQILNKTFGETE